MVATKSHILEVYINLLVFPVKILLRGARVFCRGDMFVTEEHNVMIVSGKCSCTYKPTGNSCLLQWRHFCDDGTQCYEIKYHYTDCQW